MISYYKDIFIPKSISWIKEKPLTPIFALACIPLAILIRILWPFIKIRICGLTSQRMGHYIFDIEYYLSRKKYFNENGYLDLFYLHSKPVNNYVKILAKRHILINELFKYIDFASRALPFYRYFVIKTANVEFKSRDKLDLLTKIQPSLYFNKLEEEYGLNFLKYNKIKKPYVCLMIRDNAYMKEIFKKSDLSYHDYRDSNISDYELLIKELIKYGYSVVRMGKTANEKVNFKSDKILDYPFLKQKHDLLDLWLSKSCAFAISSTPGIETAAVVFRKPVMMVNHLSYGDARTGNPNCLELFKILRHGSNNKIVSLKEQIKLGIIRATFKKQFADKNIKIENNSQKELLIVLREFMKMIQGSLILNKQDELNQVKFWKILSNWEHFDDNFGKIRPVISPYFLKKYKSLLN